MESSVLVVCTYISYFPKPFLLLSTLFQFCSFYFILGFVPAMWTRLCFLYLSECPDNTYGEGCNGTCKCNTQNTMSCNKTTGNCTCKGGWTGDSCDTDVDECLTVHCPANSQCVNLPGSYLCSCDAGFFMSNQTCVGKKLTKISLEITTMT